MLTTRKFLPYLVIALILLAALWWWTDTKAPSNQLTALSFTAISTEPDAKGNPIMVAALVDIISKNYRATSTFLDSGSIIYQDPWLCLTKNHFQYYYCVSNRELMAFIRSVVRGEDYDIDLFDNGEDQLDNSWLPDETYLHLITPPEIIIYYLENNKEVKGNITLSINNGGDNPLALWRVDNVRTVSEYVQLPSNALDLEKIVQAVMLAAGPDNGLEYLRARLDWGDDYRDGVQRSTSDQNLIGYLKSKQLELNNFRIKN